jgi:diaminopimelate decarboxylase
MSREAPHGAGSSVLPPGSGRDDRGRLTIGGCAVGELLRAVGTPAVLVEEDALRDAARAYVRAFPSPDARPSVYFASKAFPCPAVIRVFAQEGLGCDVASAGELAIALAGGMAPERILMHGNAKTDEELSAALVAGVGLIVVDSLDELDRLDRLVVERQAVLLRVNPAVAAPTHAAMATGHEGSKFGLSPAHLQIAIDRTQRHPLLRLEGLHAHVGSQITELEPFAGAVEALAGLGRFATYDLGGGLGARYTPEQPEPPGVQAYAQRLLDAARRRLPPEARVLVEPGRSLVARSAVTVYTVVSVKRAARTFVSVDGGMGDNLEPMLYQTPFAPLVLDAERPLERCDVVGRHCETGDRLVEGAMLASPRVGDALVVPVTGAYCYSTSNNYNGACRPPVLLCSGGRARIVVRRETTADLLARSCDVPVGPEMLAQGVATWR